MLNKEGKKIKEETLIKHISQYMLENPKLTEADIAKLFSKAKQEASLLSIPTYHPLHVSDKSEISDEFKESITKVNVKKALNDESTFVEEYE